MPIQDKFVAYNWNPNWIGSVSGRRARTKSVIQSEKESCLCQQPYVLKLQVVHHCNTRTSPPTWNCISSDLRENYVSVNSCNPTAKALAIFLKTYDCAVWGLIRIDSGKEWLSACCFFKSSRLVNNIGSVSRSIVVNFFQYHLRGELLPKRHLVCVRGACGSVARLGGSYCLRLERVHFPLSVVSVVFFAHLS